MDLNFAGNYAVNDYIEVQSIYDPHYECPITTSIFDDYQELLWTGNSDGRVNSYYGMSLSKYTSFRVKEGLNSDIKMLYSHMNQLFVLTSDYLCSYDRFGINNFKHSEVSFQNLQCMFFNQQQRFFLAGFSDFIFDFDIERLRILRQIRISDEQADCILINSSTGSNTSGGASTAANNSVNRNGVVCTGSSNGQIFVRDPFTLKHVHKFHPHSGSLSDFDVNGNYLASCGFSLTRNGNLAVDRFIMIYDLRMMRALSPIQLIIEPCFLNYLPVCSSVIAVASQSACFQLTDTNLMTPSPFYQASVPTIEGLATSFSMSSNCQSFAFGHSSGSIHLFSKGDNILFNDFSEPTFIVEPPQLGENFIDINDELTSLSSVPVPLTNQALASDWHSKDTKVKYKPTPVIDGKLMENPRIIHGIISVSNKFEMKRNQIYNSNYQNLLREMEKRAKETSLPLEKLVKEDTEQETKQFEEKNEASEKIQKEDKDKQIESFNEQVQASEQMPSKT